MGSSGEQSLRTRLFLQPKQQSRRNQTMRNIKPLRRNQPTQQEHRQTIRQNHKTNNTTKTINRNTHRRNQHTTRSDKMLVQISDKEQNRVKTATEYYKQQGHTVTTENLQIGDYIFNDKVVFEFKTISDFIASIQDNRVFNEAINQAETYDYHYVIIQGDEATRAKCIAMSRNYHEITYFQYLGAIASLNRYTTVIESYSPFINEAYHRMQIQAEKCLQNRPIVKKFPKKHKNSAFNFLCYTIYGINYKKADAIVKEYNLKTLSDLQNLTIEKLVKVDGIGERNAKRIMEAIK